MNAEEFKQLLDGSVKDCGGGFKGHCPAHDDNTPSLTFCDGEDGRLVVRCHAGCDFMEIVRALNCHPSDFFHGDPKKMQRSLKPKRNHGVKSRSSTVSKSKEKAEPNKKPVRKFDTLDEAVASSAWGPWKLTKVWKYHDEDRKLAYATARYDNGKKKRFVPVHQRDDSKWVLKLPEDRILYRLPDLKLKEEVFVVEGEKCADALWSIGIAATTSPNGSQSAKKTDWTPLMDKKVWIWPDNDEAGLKYADDVLEIFAGFKRFPRTFLVKAADLFGHHDAADLIEHLIADGTPKRELHPTVKQQYLFKRYESVSVNDVVRNYNPEPEKIKAMDPVFKVTEDMLPCVLRDWVKNLCESFGKPYDYTATTLITLCGGVIGRKISARTMGAENNLSVCPNMYTMVVGRSSSGKSPLMGPVIGALKNSELKRLKQTNEVWNRWDLERTLTEQAIAKFSAMSLKHCSTREDRLEVAEKIESMRSEIPMQPKRHQIFVNDATIASIQSTLATSPYGCILENDEIAAFLTKISKESGYQADARPTILSMWDGDQKVKVGRVKREDIEYWANLTIIGGIQPELLYEYIAESKGLQDGFLQRFMITFPDFTPFGFPSETQKLDNDDAELFFDWLVNLPRDKFGAEHKQSPSEDRDDDIYYLDCEPDALALLKDYAEWNTKCAVAKPKEVGRKNGDDLESLITKNNKKVGFLAATFQVIDYGGGRINRNSVAKAIKWCDYYLSCWFRIRSQVGNKTILALNSSIDFITKKQPEFNRRHLMRELGLGEDLALEVIGHLIEMKWITTEDDIEFHLNPRVYEMIEQGEVEAESQESSLLVAYAYGRNHDLIIANDGCLQLGDLEQEIFSTQGERCDERSDSDGFDPDVDY